MGLALGAVCHGGSMHRNVAAWPGRTSAGYFGKAPPTETLVGRFQVAASCALPGRTPGAQPPLGWDSRLAEHIMAPRTPGRRTLPHTHPPLRSCILLLGTSTRRKEPTAVSLRARLHCLRLMLWADIPAPRCWVSEPGLQLTQARRLAAAGFCPCHAGGEAAGGLSPSLVQGARALHGNPPPRVSPSSAGGSAALQLWKGKGPDSSPFIPATLSRTCHSPLSPAHAPPHLTSRRPAPSRQR